MLLGDANIYEGMKREPRYEAFAAELDELKRRISSKLGEEDVRYIRRVYYFSRFMEIVGRVFIHFSLDPFTFLFGVLALWVHKQLSGTEIGHMVLHGAYDGLPGAEAFASRKFRWDTQIDEEAWHLGHNMRHHVHTNVADKDPDMRFGPVHLTDGTQHSWRRYWQYQLMLGLIFTNFGLFMNAHFTGVVDALLNDGPGMLPDRSWASIRNAWKKALRKYVPFYFKNYVFFPALAGLMFWNVLMFWKVLLGNYLAELLGNLYSAATIFCGHVGQDVKNFPAGQVARSRGEWYAMQVETTNDFEVGAPWSILCGGLERHIEHHLFPKLPAPRLREIAPEVRAICARHGVEYKTGSWPVMLKKALVHLRQLAQDGGARAVLQEMS